MPTPETGCGPMKWKEILLTLPPKGHRRNTQRSNLRMEIMDLERMSEGAESS